MYLGDVGATLREEINIVEKGMNYGAGKVEGTCTRPTCREYADPVVALPKSISRCVIGGVVYRNQKRSPFYGVYIFADYQLSNLLALKYASHQKSVGKVLKLAARAPGNISSMGQDALGRIYAATYVEKGSGDKLKTHIYRLSHPQLLPKGTTSSMDFRNRVTLSPSNRNPKRFTLQGRVLKTEYGEPHETDISWGVGLLDVRWW